MRLTSTALLVTLTGTAAAAPPAKGRVCDTGDRIFVVDAKPRGKPTITPLRSTIELTGTVVVITRADGKRAEAPLAAGSISTDECGGTGGGHAGCSYRGGFTIRSRVLGSDQLFLGTFRTSLLLHANTGRICRDSDQDPWFLTCSTKSWFVVVGHSHDQPFIRVYRGPGVTGTDAEQPDFQEDVELKPDGSYVGTQASVLQKAGVTTIEFDGVREQCLAIYRPPP